MKIIERGKHQDWWVGKISKCVYCGTKVELDVTDNIHVVINRNNQLMAHFDCPNCFNKMWVYPGSNWRR